MDKILETLNEPQREAVLSTEGPLLILAGAGSGKTRALTHRAAYLIGERAIAPWNILAVTFTNKAAGEMRERIDSLVGYGSEGIWVATFHATCVRILRRYANRIGYDTNFTIYDSDDSKALMKNVCKTLNIDTKVYKERALLSAISSAKDELVTPEEFARQAAMSLDADKRRKAEAYRAYQEELKKSNAFDFDDLIMKTVELLRADAEVRDYYQERFRYVMVDEYQDTNTAQFELVRLLSGKYGNLCVVGDDDQSIYRFRGANIWNILNFEKYFPDAKVVKLEQNYRSTQNILDAANAVIGNNEGRKEKSLWTENGRGAPVGFRQLDTAYEEAEFIASEIAKGAASGTYRYGDNAVLYRTNAQSRLLEEKLIFAGIPYKIVGGVNFYARREIKDLLAYLKTIDNARDELAVRRILNVPKRGIGQTTMNRVSEYAAAHDMGFYDALKVAANQPGEVPGIGKGASKLAGFVNLIQVMRSKAHDLGVKDLLSEVIGQTGYIESLKADDAEDAKERVENIDELISKAAAYEEAADEPGLGGFLEEVALVADIDGLDPDGDAAVLMTLHAAKGLEFPRVFLAGMEDGLFPSYMSITDENATEALEEERRLAYVGITRAMRELVITCARSRVIRGQTQFNRVSRFVREIPQELMLEGDGDVFGIEPEFADDEENLPEFLRNSKSCGLAEYGSADWQGGRKSKFGGDPSRTGDDGATGYARNGNLVGSHAGGDRPGGHTQHGSSAGRHDMGDESGRNTANARGYSRTKVTRQPSGQAMQARAFASAHTKTGSLSYGVGDRVRHSKFGEGTVTAIVEGGRDFEVTVDFDGAGTKKMFAMFAKLEKIF